MTKKKAIVKKMTTKTNPQKKSFVTEKIVAIGAGVAALGAATYYFFGPKGKKHQKETKTWMRDMEADILKKIGKTEKATEKTYHEIVDSIAKTYAKYGEAEVAPFAKILKTQWKGIQKSVKKTHTKSTPKKVTRKQ